jgi:hypothetical protein
MQRKSPFSIKRNQSRKYPRKNRRKSQKIAWMILILMIWMMILTWGLIVHQKSRNKHHNQHSNKPRQFKRKMKTYGMTSMTMTTTTAGANWRKALTITPKTWIYCRDRMFKSTRTRWTLIIRRILLDLEIRDINMIRRLNLSKAMRIMNGICLNLFKAIIDPKYDFIHSLH